MSYQKNYALIDWSKEIVIERKEALPPQRSDLPFPMVMNDALDAPVQSMVDGSWHTSKSSLRKTYLPSGNKEGARYLEVGNDPARLKPRAKPQMDDRKISEAVDKAVSRFSAGERI